MRFNFLQWLDGQRRVNHNTLVKAPPPSPSTAERRSFKARGTNLLTKDYAMLPNGAIRRRNPKPWRGKSERRQVLKARRDEWESKP